MPYDGEPHTVAGALVCGEGVTVQYHVPITDIEGNEVGDTWVNEPPAYTQPGEYTVTCAGSKGGSAKVLTVVLKIEEMNIETHLTIIPSPAGLTGGGDVTLTVSGMPGVGNLSVTGVGNLSVTCDKSVTVNETNTRGVYTVTLPDADGTYTFTASYSGAGSYQPAEATCTVMVTKTNIETHLTITPSPTGLTGGGEVTLTVSGMPDVGDLTVTCDKSVTVNDTNTRGVYTVTLPDENGTYTFTASYSGAGSYQPAEATCTVTVTGSTVTTKYAISLDAPTGSTVAVTVEGTAATEAENGKTVTVAVTGADDKAVSVAVTDADSADVAAAKDAGSNTWTFTMPDKAVTVKVTITSGTVTVDKTALNTAIEAANTAKEGVEVKPDGTTAADVPKGVKFVTEAEMKALTDAIAAAEEVAGNGDATQDKVNAAVTTLNTAVEAFKGAIKTGTYTPSVPSVIPPSGSSTTSVKKNEDGSTTTTVTDRKTGTVTETTEKPDGTKQVVETKKDGTVTETIEKVDGSKQIVETRKDGTVTETIEKVDGTKQVVEAKKDGTVTETIEKVDGTKQIVETRKDGTVTETKVDPEGGTAEKITDPEKNVEIKVTGAAGEVLAEVRLPAEVTVPETRFQDVPENHWADEAVHEMAGLGLVNGAGNDKFDMSSGMKRGDLALLLARLSNAKGDYELTFTDVPSDKYYAGGVAWAAKSGVVTGRSADTFDPETTITRSELAVMLYRYAKLLKLDTSASTSELDAFTDGADTAEWAAGGLAWCVKNGIMQGRGGNILDTKSNVTRAEVAVMLQRFIHLTK